MIKPGKPWEECDRCSTIENKVSIDMRGKRGHGISPKIKALRGMKAVDFGVGYRSWMLMCELCGAEYFARIDNEDGAWDFNLERRKNDNPVIYQAPLKKEDFKDKFDFEVIGKATEVVVHMKDGESHHVGIMDYWPTGEKYGDYLSGVGLSKAPIERTRYGGNNSKFEFMVPSPEIESIDVLSGGDEPNHGSHPEYAFVVDTLDDLFIKD